MTTFDPEALSRRELNGLMNGLVAPRPVAWVSTVDENGGRNLAPFSYFNVFSYQPPMLAIGPGRRTGMPKDTLRNIQQAGEFVVNVVARHLAQAANATSAPVGQDVDEWDLVGLTPAESEMVRPARVRESPAAFECTTVEIVELTPPGAPPTNALIVGAVRRIFVSDAALDGLVPRPEILELVGRMGEDLWCTTRDRFSLPQPDAGTVADTSDR